MEQQSSLLKEIRPHGTRSFPCAIYRTHSSQKGVFVKHHWHEEVELLYFSGGEFWLEVNMESFPIQSECFYFINPGELHSIMAETSRRHWEDAIVFSPGILSFDSCDEAQIHLINPVLNGRLLFPRCITPEQPAFIPVRNAFLDICRSFGQAPLEEPARQLYAKASLLQILATLSTHGLFTPTEKNMDKRVEDIKTALTYIKDNYQEKIYISHLAEQVSLNEQYFSRLFKKVIGHSPMEYINEYRVKQARRLLEKTDLLVTEICLECGYNNLGNFLREFRKYTGTTPLQYRKHSGKNSL